MGLFVSSKKEKETWASIVLSGIKPGMQIDDALLEKVADIYTKEIRGDDEISVGSGT